jgi:organic hydroperoxide reductase OsmC/OhrA
MTAFEREATIRWLTKPPEGLPRMSVGSGSLHSLLLSVDPEAAHPLATSPAELLAGAIGTIFAWFAAQELVNGGTQARELIADVTLTVSDNDAGVTNLAMSGIVCRLLGRVPQIRQERLDEVAKAAMSRCVETIGLRTDGLAVMVEAVLEGA